MSSSFGTTTKKKQQQQQKKKLLTLVTPSPTHLPWVYLGCAFYSFPSATQSQPQVGALSLLVERKGKKKNNNPSTPQKLV
jgi:hypothetical protein